MADQRVMYLDHSASTPVDPRVVEAMLSYFTESYGNASGLHRQARASARALDQARRDVAAIFGCKPKEVVFTSCGTESDNLAIRGVAWAARLGGKRGHMITSPIEHHAVPHTIHELCDQFGFEQTVVPVDGHGLVDPEDVARAIRPDTIPHLDPARLPRGDHRVVAVPRQACRGHVGRALRTPEHGHPCREGVRALTIAHRRMPFVGGPRRGGGRLTLNDQ